MDLRPKGLTGKAAEESLGRARLTCNRTASRSTPQAGGRLRHPARLARRDDTRLRDGGFRRVGELIADVLDGLMAHPDDNGRAEKAAGGVAALCARFPDLREGVGKGSVV